MYLYPISKLGDCGCADRAGCLTHLQQDMELHVAPNDHTLHAAGVSVCVSVCV